MKSISQLLRGALVVGAVAMSSVGANADEIKVGLIGQSSGQFAWWGTEFKHGIDLALAEVGGKIDGHTITIIERDVAGINPPRARQLAQELIVRDRVQYLIGGVFSPTVMATAPVINEAKVPFIVFNTGASDLTKASKYFVRVGVSQWTLNIPVGKWAYDQGGRKAAIMVADYSPGQDGAAVFKKSFEDAGGKIIEDIRVPVGTIDFSSYVQKLRDAKPQYVFIFMPVGPMTVAMVKAITGAELEKQGIIPIYTTEMQDQDLPTLGDAALGAKSFFHYSPQLDNPKNKAVTKELKDKYGQDQMLAMGSLSAYDGMQVLFHMIKATGGKYEPDKAMASVKGMKWESPRGPVSIDDNREIVQNMYLRKVERLPNGKLANETMKTFPAVGGPGYEMP